MPGVAAAPRGDGRRLGRVERMVCQASQSRKTPPTRPSTWRALTRTSVMALSPNAAIAPYVASAVATPSPETSPTSRPSARVRRMTSRLIGPTAAAMVKPRMKPRNVSAGSTMVSFREHEKTPRHVPGRHSGWGRRLSGARVRSSGPVGPSGSARGARVGVMSRAGWGIRVAVVNRPRPSRPATFRSMTTTTTRRPLKVGIQLPEVEREVRWPELLDMVRAIEDLGFDSVWVGEHLLYRWPDGRRAGRGRPGRSSRPSPPRRPGSSSGRSSPAPTSTIRPCSPSRPRRSTRSAAGASSSVSARAGTRPSSAPSASRTTIGSTASRRRSRSSGRSCATAPSTSTGTGTRPATASCCRAARARRVRR